MNEAIIVGVLSCLGTIIGSLGGVMASAKLTNYRIAQLEKKVEKHNNFGIRIPVLEEKLESDEERIKKLEKFHLPN